MPKTFTYEEGDLSTALAYARWRLDDTNPGVRVDSTGEPAPYIWDEEYLALFARFSVTEATARCAEKIAAALSKGFIRFQETGGVRIDKNPLAYYRDLADKIRKEPSWSPDEISAGIRVGALKKAAAKDSLAFRQVTTYPPPGK